MVLSSTEVSGDMTVLLVRSEWSGGVWLLPSSCRIHKVFFARGTGTSNSTCWKFDHTAVSCVFVAQALGLCTTFDCG